MSQGLNLGSFPRTRMRRNRSDSWLRSMLAENNFSASDLIWPVFIIEGENKKEEIATMSGVYRYSVDLLLKEVKIAAKLGIPAIAIFPVIPEGKKSKLAEESYNPDNLICKAVRAIKQSTPEIGVICDVALDPYSSHGHDGIIEDGCVENDKTIAILCQQALVQAQAGCDIIAPSDMMDGRIGAIRDFLDDAGYKDVKILSYAAKYASNFYAPFRDAVGSAKNLKSASKETYQMNPANAKEALREVALDIQEGADMVMVKPGLPYLDIIANVSSKFNIPVLAYHVSGEYAMVKAAAEKGIIDEMAIFTESMIAFKRAGATAIITYAAIDLAKTL